MRLLLPLLLLLGACAQGPSCSLERLSELPVRMVGNVPVLQAGINGQDASMVLDTGANITVLNRTAARRLGIEAGAGQVSMTGAGGTAQGVPARVAKVTLGAAVSNDVQVLLADTPPGFDGLLGLNVLIDYELELDAAHGRAVFYRARPCPAIAPNWTGPYRSMPVAQRPGTGYLFVPVVLEDQPLTGLLDTGTSMTTLSFAAAQDARITPGMLRNAPAVRGQSMNPEGVLVRARRFRSLRVGPDEMSNPVLAIADLPPLAGDVVVGSDYLATRRLWISVLLGRVYVTAEP